MPLHKTLYYPPAHEGRPAGPYKGSRRDALQNSRFLVVPYWIINARTIKTVRMEPSVLLYALVTRLPLIIVPRSTLASPFLCIVAKHQDSVSLFGVEIGKRCNDIMNSFLILTLYTML